MENINQTIEKENKKSEQPDDDWTVYIPDAEMRAFERMYANLETAREEFLKFRESLNRIEN
jgi:hypothetical protein